MRIRMVSLSLALLCALFSLPGAARAEKITVDEDTFFTLGVLAQPQLVLTQEGTPDGGLASDIFLRRGRIVFTGQIDPNIGFILITDQANWGKNGDFSQPFFIQDALASYKFGPGLTIDAGFMLLPFVRNDYQGAGGLNTIEFRTPVIKFPISRGFRDMGIEARGLLLNDLLYYRVGVFNGIAGKPGAVGPPPTPAVNEGDSPRLTGNVRFNIMGKEEAYAFSGIYFAAAPIVNVGVGFDWQNEAYGADTKHLGLSADVFVDYPIDADNELLFQAAFLRYDDYLAGATPESGNAFYVEAGYRFHQVEPLIALENFQGEDTLRATTLRLGLNWFISKHTYNLKAEVAIPMNEDPAVGTADDNLVITVQNQVSF